MTERKQVASTLKKILEHPVSLDIFDRTANIEKALDTVQSWWGYDLFTRKPGPAYYENGIFHATDLDLACFLYNLLGRDAVINIPYYKARTGTVIREDQKVTSKDNRHGAITGLLANKDFFSFSVRIKDMNVVGEDKVGFDRTFMLTDYDGSFYKGWRTIEFVPTMKENRFITENQLWTGNKIYFKNFVSPNRWVSLFGHHYILTKLMEERLSEEATFLRSQQKEMLENGITFPKGEGPQVAEAGTYTYGRKVSLKFPAFEVKLQHPEFKGDYQALEQTPENLVHAYKTAKLYSNTIVPRLRFMTRATELAHSQAPNRLPVWIKNAQWEDEYKESPRARTKWRRLILFQPEVGQKGFSILTRSYEKAKQVSAD